MEFHSNHNNYKILLEQSEHILMIPLEQKYLSYLIDAAQEDTDIHAYTLVRKLTAFDSNCIRAVSACLIINSAVYKS